MINMGLHLERSSLEARAEICVRLLRVQRLSVYKKDEGHAEMLQKRCLTLRDGVTRGACVAQLIKLALSLFLSIERANKGWGK